MNKSDWDIIKAIKDGKDKEVIQSLYIDVLPNVEYFVCSNSGSKAEAFDVFHDALLVFYKEVIAERFNSEKYKVAGFIYSVSKNLWINTAKKKNTARKWEAEQDQLDVQSSYLDTIISEERTNVVNNLFNNLDDYCIQLLTMSIYHKLSMKEIADKIGSNENTVKVQCFRCRKKLSDMVKANPALMNILKN